jgi:hypothetical protein
MWFPRLSTVVRVYRRITNSQQHTAAVRQDPHDAQWWQGVCQQASADALAGTRDLRRELEPQLGRWQTPRAVWFDQERGSLRIVLRDGQAVTVATGDTLTAPALAAAAELGGLKLRLTLRATGMLQVHAAWESWHGAVEGIPAALAR